MCIYIYIYTYICVYIHTLYTHCTHTSILNVQHDTYIYTYTYS